jgi:hypothetical protein
LEARGRGVEARPAALGVWGALRSLPRPSLRDPALNVALCWKLCKSQAADARRKQPEEPWYLATSLSTARRAASWYWQRGWIERSLRDAKSCFGLKRVKVGSRERLGRPLVGLTIALCWLTLMALPEGGVLPKGFRSMLVAWGRASVNQHRALAFGGVRESTAMLSTSTTASGVGGYVPGVGSTSMNTATERASPPSLLQPILKGVQVMVHAIVADHQDPVAESF